MKKRKQRNKKEDSEVINHIHEHKFNFPLSKLQVMWAVIILTIIAIIWSVFDISLIKNPLFTFINKQYNNFSATDKNVHIETNKSKNDAQRDPENISVKVYTDELESEWRNYSYNTDVNFEEEKIIDGKEERVIKVVYNKQGEDFDKGLLLSYGTNNKVGIETTPNSKLLFDIMLLEDSGITKNIEVQLNALPCFEVNGKTKCKELEPYELNNKLNTKGRNQWEAIDIPMYELNPNNELIKEISIYSEKHGILYLNNIRIEESRVP